MNRKEIGLNLKGVNAEIIYHYFNNIKIKTFLLSFSKRRRVLSTLEGFKEVRFVGNHYNPPKLWDFVHKNKKEYEERIYSDLGIDSNDIAMLFTGVDMDNICFKKEIFQDIEVCACVTAGVKSNAQRIGIDKAGYIEIKKDVFEPIGTVNIIILLNSSLTDGAMARSIITATEAKTIAFQDLDIRSSYNPELQATGTGTDNIVIVSGFGQEITYVGGHAKIGEIIARTVTCAVKEAILKQEVQNAG